MEDKDFQALIDCANKELTSYRLTKDVSCLSRIVRLAAEGDQRGLLYLITILRPYIVRWIYRGVMSNSDIDDIFQETIISLLTTFTRHDHFKSSSNTSFFAFLKYACKTARSSLLQYYRQMGQSSKDVYFEEANLFQSKNTIDDAFMRVIIIDIVQKILNSEEKEVFLHRFVMNKKPAEIAQDLKMDEHIIRNIITRIIRRLKNSQDLRDLVETRENDLNRFWAENIIKIDGSS